MEELRETQGARQSEFDILMDKVEECIEEGILGREEMPIQSREGGSIWNWPVLQFDQLPEYLKIYVSHGRLYL